MIIKDKNVCGGQPVIKGTRILVSVIIANIKDEVPFDEICRSYGISKDDIMDCVDHAGIKTSK